MCRVLLGLCLSALVYAAGQDGATIYATRCAKCHDHVAERVPSKESISKRSPEVILRALRTGPMKPFATGLTDEDLNAVTTFLTGKSPAVAPTVQADANVCTGPAPRFSLSAPHWLGWGQDLDNSRFQPNPGIKAEDVGKLKVKWAFGYSGNLSYGQPVMAGGRVFVTTASGQVFALDAATGCTYWSYNAGAGVRTAVSIGPMPDGAGARYAAYIGDEQTWVHALDAETGKLLWKARLDDHPLARIAGAPILNGDRLYVPVSSWEEGAGQNPKYECCKFQGTVSALNAYSGQLLWQSRTMKQRPRPFKKNSAGTQMFGPAGAAVWSAPTLDLKRKAVYAATGNSYTDVEQDTANAILAFDMNTGRLLWSNQVTPKDNYLVGCVIPGAGNCPSPVGPDVDFGSSPILRSIDGGKQLLLAGQKSGVLYALDPDQNGKTVWQQKIGEGSPLGGIEWGPAADRDQVYVAISDVMPKAGKVPGGLTALKIATGERVWHTPAPKVECSFGSKGCSPAQSAAVTVMPGVVFSGALDGHLRGYSTKDGSIVWDFDTGVAFETVNGVAAKGGSIDAAGPAIAGGMVLVNSGYGRFVGAGGNVLLAFTVDGK